MINIIAILFIAIFILIVIRRGENDKSEERVRKKHNLPTRVISPTEDEKVIREKKKRKDERKRKKYKEKI